MNMFGEFDMDTRGKGVFTKNFKCYSMKKKQASQSTIDRLENGGKILMPQSSLETLSTLNIMYPMLFEVSSDKTNKKTNCGVLEFTAEEGRVYMPSWMIKQLGIQEGEIITIKSTSLSRGTFVKLQPQNLAFLDISNPKAVLERELTNFACLTEEDVFSFIFNGKVFEMKVVELKPQKAVTIIEADIMVDFLPPPGYVEPQKQPSPPIEEDEEMTDASTNFVPFSGAGNSLRGTPIPIISSSSSGDLVKRNVSSPPFKSPSTTALSSSKNSLTFGSPSPRSASPITLPPGKLIFSSPSNGSLAKSPAESEKRKSDGFSAFTGKGNSLR